MGFFDKIKNAMGGGESEKDTTVAPSRLLSDAGVDPSGLNFSFGTGSISVSGTIDSEADRAKVLEVLSGINGISTVNDNMSVAAPPAAAPEPTPEPPPEPEPTPAPTPPPSEAPIADDVGVKTYTVKSGDSLWKIAEEMYGNGTQFTAIFEANKDILDDPDKIFPGQELKIPELKD